MLAGRPHEAAGNGSPRWMAAGPRHAGAQNPAYRPARPPLRLLPAPARSRLAPGAHRAHIRAGEHRIDRAAVWSRRGMNRAPAWSLRPCGICWLLPAPPALAQRSGGVRQISAVNLITRWIATAGNLDIWRVPADRVPVSVNRPGFGEGGIRQHPGPAIIRTREPRPPVPTSAGPADRSQDRANLVLADLGGQLLRRGRAEHHGRAGQAAPGAWGMVDC